MSKPKVAIIMGSTSDMAVMQETMAGLQKFNIPFEVNVLSAHRTPKQVINYIATVQKRGIKVIIAAAGGAAHLAGVVAAHTILPVIGVPMETKSLAGIDSLMSTVQMPSGIPVATLTIGKAGAKNAAILAVQILALDDKKLAARLKRHKKEMTAAVLKKNRSLKNK